MSLETKDKPVTLEILKSVKEKLESDISKVSGSGNISEDQISQAINDYFNSNPVVAESDIYYDCTKYGVTPENEDNTPAFQALVDMVHENGGGTIYIPIGTYNFKSFTAASNENYAIVWKSNVSVIGEDEYNTVLVMNNTKALTLFWGAGTKDTPLENCRFENFCVDGYACTESWVYAKAFFMKYIKHCMFRYLYLKGTGATALGVDMLYETTIDHVTCYECGRVIKNAELESGHAGIGIGTGGFENENIIITNNICDSCGKWGIFIESQFLMHWGGSISHTKGCIIANNIVRNSKYYGIGAVGGKNFIISNNVIYDCEVNGISIHGGVNYIVSNNEIAGCKNSGVAIWSRFSPNTNAVIENNNISECKYGVTVLNDDDNSTNGVCIRDNNITKNTSNAIELSCDISDLTIVNNSTRDNSKGLYINHNTYTNAVILNNYFLDDLLNDGGAFTGITTFIDKSIIGTACTGVSLNSNTLLFSTRDSQTLSVTLAPSDTTEKVVWSTSDVYIATVDENGVVTPHQDGTCIVTAYCGAFSDECEVTVSDLPADTNKTKTYEINTTFDTSKDSSRKSILSLSDSEFDLSNKNISISYDLTWDLTSISGKDIVTSDFGTSISGRFSIPRYGLAAGGTSVLSNGEWEIGEIETVDDVQHVVARTATTDNWNLTTTDIGDNCIFIKCSYCKSATITGTITITVLD